MRYLADCGVAGTIVRGVVAAVADFGVVLLHERSLEVLFVHFLVILEDGDSAFCEDELSGFRSVFSDGNPARSRNKQFVFHNLDLFILLFGFVIQQMIC